MLFKRNWRSTFSRRLLITKRSELLLPSGKLNPLFYITRGAREDDRRPVRTSGRHTGHGNYKQPKLLTLENCKGHQEGHTSIPLPSRLAIKVFRGHETWAGQPRW